MLTQARLKELLHYDPETGAFTWLRKQGAKAAGQRAGCVDKRFGYVLIRVDGVLFGAHRLACLYMTGEHPKDEIDHKNGVPADNRWTNLRLASREENMRNTRVRSDNRCGEKGVRLHPRWGWQARCQQRHLGWFTTKEEAASVARKERERCFGEFSPDRRAG